MKKINFYNQGLGEAGVVFSGDYAYLASKGIGLQVVLILKF